MTHKGFKGLGDGSSDPAIKANPMVRQLKPQLQDAITAIMEAQRHIGGCVEDIEELARENTRPDGRYWLAPGSVSILVKYLTGVENSLAKQEHVVARMIQRVEKG